MKSTLLIIPFLLFFHSCNLEESLKNNDVSSLETKESESSKEINQQDDLEAISPDGQIHCSSLDNLDVCNTVSHCQPMLDEDGLFLSCIEVKESKKDKDIVIIDPDLNTIDLDKKDIIEIPCDEQLGKIEVCVKNTDLPNKAVTLCLPTEVWLKKYKDKVKSHEGACDESELKEKITLHEEVE